MRMNLALFLLFVALAPFASAEESPQRRLEAYRAELTAFRKEFGGSKPLPQVEFYLFGMGARTKLLYKEGKLVEAVGGTLVRQFSNVTSQVILPADYEVHLTTADGARVRIWEDEKAVWVSDGEQIRAVEGTQKPVRLPTFSEFKHPAILRVLHQELLVNVIEGKPVPNFFVYDKPWYRDGAMMAMCFKETGNLDVMKDWVMGLREPYDKNNNGESEADNLGQALYLISLYSDQSHPLVAEVLKEVPRWEVRGEQGRYIKGRSDFAEHPAYQTKWLKLGLAALKLDDPYVVPKVKDSYSALFWMDYKDSYVKGGDSDDRGNYPYLGWACDHFHGENKGPISDRDYPLTWEAKASQAKYEGMRVISDEYVTKKTAAPHTWHAAEIFLYLLEMKK